MTLSVTHATQSAVVDDGVAGEIGPSEWNEAHTITGSVAASEITSPGDLTKTDDTNVTLTLGGTPTGALLASTSLTLGWTGQLAASRGGTGLSALGTGVATALGVNVGSAGAFVTFNGALGTPASGTLTNATGLPLAGITGFGTNVATALGVNVGSAGSVVVNGGALGTPSSGTLTSCTGLPVGTGISGFGTGVATALAVNVGSAGAPVVFNGAGGTPSSLVLTNATVLPLTSGVTGVLPIANGGTNAATAADAFANIKQAASDTATGAIEIAIQSEQETGTDVVRAVTPGRQQFHPSAAKVWARIDYSGGVPTATVSYNVTSITDSSTGVAIANFTTSFSAANYASLAVGQPSGAVPISDFTGNAATGSITMSHYEASTLTDPTKFDLVCFGDQ